MTKTIKQNHNTEKQHFTITKKAVRKFEIHLSNSTLLRKKLST
jgi:hypothetical protein